MPLMDMAKDYRQGGEMIRLRIIALRSAAAETEDIKEKQNLEGRIRDLAVLLRETREIAQVLERYYDRRYHNNERYTL